MTFRIKKEPVKPTRETETVFSKGLSSYEDYTIQEILDMVPDEYEGQYDKIELVQYSYYDEHDLTLEIDDLEDEATFNDRLIEYNKKFEDWQRWANQNKDAIEAELTRRKKVVTNKSEKQLSTLRRQQTAIESQIARLEKTA